MAFNIATATQWVQDFIRGCNAGVMCLGYYKDGSSGGAGEAQIVPMAVDADGVVQCNAVANIDTLTINAVGSAIDPTETNVNVVNTSATVLAANSSRYSLLLVNNSDTDMYLALTGAAVVGHGIPLKAFGGSYDASKMAGNVPLTAITAIHGATGNKVLYVQEGVAPTS